MTAGDVADWWDGRRRKTSQWLESFIDESPTTFTVVGVALSESALDLGAGLVDLLRIGEGAAEGGWGWGKDALRLVGLAGPIGKVAQIGSGVRATNAARLISDPGGPICSWVSQTKALRHVGQKVDGKLFVVVDDLVTAAGETMHSIGSARFPTMMDTLRRIGARVGPTRTVTKASDVIDMLPRDGSVVAISVKALRNGSEIGGHAFYAFRDALGRVRYMDRTGVHASIGEVAAQYASVADEFVPRTAAVISNVFGKYVDGTYRVGVLAMEANVLVPMPDSTREAADRAYAQAKAGRIAEPNPRFHKAVGGDTLGSLAQRYYTDRARWPVIFAGNAHLFSEGASIGPTTPIHVGASVWIPR